MGLSLKLQEAQRLLEKLGWERAGDAKDIIWPYRASDGRPVLWTKLSKGRGDMKGNVADKFRPNFSFRKKSLIKRNKGNLKKFNQKEKDRYLFLT